MDEKLTDVLACPYCKQSVYFEAEGNVFVCRKCRAIFPIEDGVIIMTPGCQNEASGSAGIEQH